MSEHTMSAMDAALQLTHEALAKPEPEPYRDGDALYRALRDMADRPPITAPVQVKGPE